MSGHSKWATIKYKKGAADQARSKLRAKIIRKLEVAAREGGSDINTNASLRTEYEKARAASVPMDTIERAIKRGTGELEGVRYEAVNYEGYAPGGVAVIAETLGRDAPLMARLAPEVPVPASLILEEQVVPGAAAIVAAACKLMDKEV